MADGSITFSTDLDNAQLEKQLQSLKKKIGSIEDQISQKQAEKMPLVKQSAELAANLDLAQSKLEYMRSGKEFFSVTSVQEQAATVKSIESDWNKVQGRVEQYDTAISNANIKLNRQKESAGAIERELANAGSSAGLMAPALDRASRYMDKFVTRVKGLMRRVLIFTVITAALRSFKNWMGKVIKTNAAASQAMARLKGALLTLAQPLVNVVIPAFTALVTVLTRIVTALAQAMAMISGTTLEKSKKAAESLYEETEALEGTGEAADDAKKSLASFDEINQLSDGESAKKNEGVTPNFNSQENASEEELGGILNVIEAIAAGLLAWKAPDSFLSGLKAAAGLFVAIKGAIGLVKNLTDAWTNGVDWDSFLGMLGRSFEFAAGLALAFGKTGAAIGLIISGIALFATGVHDAMENGWNLQNLLTTITGMIMGGLGISILTGSWIPLIIAGIAAVLLALTVAFGQGENLLDGAKAAFQGLINFVKGVFTGNLSLALLGVEEFFDGISLMVQSVFAAAANAVNSFFDWLDKITGGKVSGLINWMRNLILGLIQVVSKGFYGLFDAFKEIFTGIIEFLSGVFTADWDKAWKGIKDIFTGVINGIISVFETFVNLIIKALNSLIDALNGVVSKAGNVIGVDWSIPSIPSAKIPHLATGAVIPPNREFMAVLGDQKSGTNIEAPVSEIEAAVARGIAASGGASGRNGGDIILQIDGKVFARITNPYYAGEQQRVGIKLVGGAT